MARYDTGLSTGLFLFAAGTKRARRERRLERVVLALNHRAGLDQ